MKQLAWTALAVLGLAGCGIYGPPERAAAPQPEAPVAAVDAGLPEQSRDEPEKAR